MLNSITTKNLPQTRVVTRFGIDEASIEALAIQAAAQSKDAFRGLVVPRKGIFTYESSTDLGGGVFFLDKDKKIPKDETKYFDGEEWIYVVPETSLPDLSSLKVEHDSLSWSNSFSSEKEQIDSIRVGKQVELTFKRGAQTATKKIYVSIEAPVMTWTETSTRVVRFTGRSFSVVNATCEDFGSFNIDEEIPANQIDCTNGFAVVPIKYDMGSRPPNSEEKIVASAEGLNCKKCNCCAICEDFYNTFTTLAQATEVRDSEFQGYEIIQKTYNVGSIGQNLNMACENLMCYSIVLPQAQVPAY